MLKILAYLAIITSSLETTDPLPHQSKTKNNSQFLDIPEHTHELK